MRAAHHARRLYELAELQPKALPPWHAACHGEINRVICMRCTDEMLTATDQMRPVMMAHEVLVRRPA